MEPGVSFSCDIDYDPFRLMEERDLKYGTSGIVSIGDIAKLTYLYSLNLRLYDCSARALLHYPNAVG